MMPGHLLSTSAGPPKNWGAGGFKALKQRKARRQPHCVSHLLTPSTCDARGPKFACTPAARLLDKGRAVCSAIVVLGGLAWPGLAWPCGARLGLPRALPGLAFLTLDARPLAHSSRRCWPRSERLMRERQPASQQLYRASLSNAGR